MVDTKCDLSALCTIYPTITELLDRDTSGDTSDSSDDYIYHLVDSSEHYIDISNGDAVNSTQDPPRPRYQQNRVSFSNLCMRNIK